MVVCVLRNARNKFAFALGERKLLAILKFNSAISVILRLTFPPIPEG